MWINPPCSVVVSVVVLVSFVLVILLFAYRYTYGTNDTFTPVSPSADDGHHFRILNADAFRTAFRQSLHLTKHTGGNRADAIARGHRTLEACRRAYANGQFDIHDDTPMNRGLLRKLRTAADVADRMCTRRGHRHLADIPWKIAIVRQDVENGFPHTIRDVVCMPRPSLDEPFLSLVETLIHEKVHVYQRMFPKETLDAIRGLGYAPVCNRDELPRAIRRLTRSNPDLNDTVYAFYGHGPTAKKVKQATTTAEARAGGCTGGIVALYRSLRPQDLGDVRHARIASIPDGSPPRFEHPYEHMAYITARAMISENTTS